MSILICFAVKEERRHFQAPAGSDVRILVTGMGASAARSTLARSLDELPSSGRPHLVLTCGFAGGLRPDLPTGTVLFQADDEAIAARLQVAGALPARIHCAARVAITRAEKAVLRRDTQADAVEMESGTIRDLCAERNLPCATVRVISDAADEDLPIDFNPLITPDGSLRLAGLIGQVLRRPSRIPALLDLQRKTDRAARTLAGCLDRFLAGAATA